MDMAFSKFSINALLELFYTCVILYTSLYSLTESIHFYWRLLLLLFIILKRVGMIFLDIFKRMYNLQGEGGLRYNNELWRAH